MDTLKMIVVITFAMAMLASLFLIFWRFKAQDAGLQRHLQQVFAMTMIVPAIALLTLVDVMDGTLTAVLVGTMSGYLFGSSSSFSHPPRSDDRPE
jgi:heme A synthase